MFTRSETTMTRFASATEALQIFNAGPTAPEWDQAACYLLSEETPADIQEHVEITITEALQAFHRFSFQADAHTEMDEPAMSVMDWPTAWTLINNSYSAGHGGWKCGSVNQSCAIRNS